MNDRATEEGDMRVRDVLTLRDYFAAKAMSELPPQTAYNMRANETYEQYVSRRAYKVADEMLRARLA